MSFSNLSGQQSPCSQMLPSNVRGMPICNIKQYLAILSLCTRALKYAYYSVHLISSIKFKRFKEEYICLITNVNAFVMYMHLYMYLLCIWYKICLFVSLVILSHNKDLGTLNLPGLLENDTIVL